jgi:PAS domain S-box-containing protein
MSTDELCERQPQLRLVVDSVPNILWLADRGGSTYYYNKKWYEQMGEGKGHDLAPYFYSDILHPEDSRPAKVLWNDCVKNLKEFKTEYRFKDLRTGEYRWVLAHALPVKDRDKNVTWYGSYTDIDEQKKSQLKLKEMLSSQDEFLSILGHEMRNPLTVLKLNLEVALKGLEKGENKSKEQLAKIFQQCLRQSLRLNTVTEDFLNTSLIRQGKFGFNKDKSDLCELVRRVTLDVLPQAVKAESEISLEIPLKTEVYIDEKRIEQVLINLFINSFKYAPKSRITIGIRNDLSGAHLTFEDSGPGIQADVRERVFERFERANSDKRIQGLGLGLYIVKKIVEGHHGKIALVDSQGTKFEIFLPHSPI